MSTVDTLGQKLKILLFIGPLSRLFLSRRNGPCDAEETYAPCT